MPTKPLDRLLFAQGGKCFFCDVALPKAEASVEHLIPSSRAGSNSGDNCVVCCKTMNALLGSMSLKEKIKVVLSQKGSFKCPNKIGSQSSQSVPEKTKPVIRKLPQKQTVKPAKKLDVAISVSRSPNEDFLEVIKILKARGTRPRHLSSLKAILKALATFKFTDGEVKGLIERLQSSGKVVVKNELVTYKL